jgi:hypothetical protein
LPKSKTTNKYWTEETEDNLKLYIAETDFEVKSQIYSKHLDIPLNKMVENLIRRFKTKHFDIPYEDVKHQTVVHLVSKFHKFDPTLGYKSFSYFSLIGRNFLFAGNTKAYAKKLNHSDIATVDEASYGNLVCEIDEDTLFQENNKETFIVKFTDYLDNHFEELFSTLNSKKVGAALISLFKTYDNMDFLDKKTVYQVLREHSTCNTTVVTKVLKTVTPLMYKLYREYQEYGDIYNLKETGVNG